MDDVDLIAALPAPNVPLGESPGWDYETWVHDMNLRDEYAEAHDAAMDVMTAVYGEQLAGGNERGVWDGGVVVYKIGGLLDQLNEIMAFEDPSTVDGLPVARCRMVYHESGCPILIMETVRPARYGDDIPDWARRIDCHQVGLNTEGNWVIFDAGSLLLAADNEHEVDEDEREGWIDHPLPSLFAA